MEIQSGGEKMRNASAQQGAASMVKMSGSGPGRPTGQRGPPLEEIYFFQKFPGKHLALVVHKMDIQWIAQSVS